MLNTGLSEPALIDAARGYLNSYSTLTGRPEAAVGDANGEHHHRAPGRRRRLAGWLLLLASVPISAIWLTAVTLVRQDPVPQGLEGSLRTVAALAIAVAATLAVARTVGSIYQSIVPIGDVAKRFREPTLRVGPDGVEHVIRGEMARLPWEAIRRVYLAADPSGPRFICVATADPYALVPRVRRWQVTAKQNEQLHGAPVAVPLAGSGLTPADLLNAVRHYGGGHVAVG